MDLKIRILHELSWSEIKQVCLFSPEILKICTGVKYWKYKITWDFGKNELPHRNLRFAGFRKLYLSLAKCKYGHSCPYTICRLTHPYMTHEHKNEYCLPHCIAVLDPRCQYVSVRGVKKGMRCENEVGAIYRIKKYQVGAEKYCLKCLRLKCVQMSLILQPD